MTPRVIGRTGTVSGTASSATSSSSSVSDWLAMVRASVLRSTAKAAEERQLARSADNQVIPLIYGEDRIGALIKNIAPYQGILYVECLWAHQGDSVNDIKLAGKDLPPGYSVTSYDGSQGSINSTFQSAMSANGYTYSEYNPGVMMSIIGIPIGSFQGSLDFSARIKGRKVLDTRTSTVAWSDNPALCLRDFLVDTIYGMGKTVVSSSVDAVAYLNDALVGGVEKRRLVGVTFDQLMPVKNIAETLRAYAGCFYSFTEFGIKLIPDAVRSTDATYSHAAGEIARIVSLEKKDMGNVPTVVEVVYTDTSVFPWRDAYTTAEASGVAGGTVPRRVSQVPLPGIRRHSQANREAIERLNKLRLTDLTMVLDVFDKGIAHEEGDVVEVTHPIGLTSKKFRIGPPELIGPGLWRLTGNEYDPANYSDSLAAGPTYADTDCVAPIPPPPINLFPDPDFCEDVGNSGAAQDDCRALRNWGPVSFGTPTTPKWGRNFNFGVSWNLGRGGAWIEGGGATYSSSQGLYMYSGYIPCLPGLYYELSVRAAIHRCKGWMYLRFFNAAKTAFKDAQSGSHEIDSGSTTILGSSDRLDDRPLLFRFDKAPVTADGSSGWSDSTAQDAAFIQVILGLTGNGGTWPYVFWHQLGLYCHGTRSGVTIDRATPWADALKSTYRGLSTPTEVSCSVGDYCNYQTQSGAHTYKYHQSGSWSLQATVYLSAGDSLLIDVEGYIIVNAGGNVWGGVVTDVLVSGSGKAMFHSDGTDSTGNLLVNDSSYMPGLASTDRYYMRSQRVYTAPSNQTVTVGVIVGKESASSAGSTFGRLRLSKVLT